MAQTTIIKATSRTSIKVGDSFYTVEYGEERSIEDDDIIEKERSALWDTCNGEVDQQIDTILQMFKDRKKY